MAYNQFNHRLICCRQHRHHLPGPRFWRLLRLSRTVPVEILLDDTSTGRVASVIHLKARFLACLFTQYSTRCKGESRMTSENVPAVVVRYFNAIGKMDPDAWVACFAEQGTSYEPGSPTPLQGHATLRQFLAGVLGAFEKITMTARPCLPVRQPGRGQVHRPRHRQERQARHLRRYRCIRDQPGRKNPNHVGLLEPSGDDGATAGVDGICACAAIEIFGMQDAPKHANFRKDVYRSDKLPPFTPS
jgi:hypothetical protein